MSATGSELWSPPAAAAYDRGAERMMSAIVAACGWTGSFPERIDLGLRAALEFLAAEPDLARLLVLGPVEGGAEVGGCHRRWCSRYADLLRSAADRAADVPGRPSFFEPAIVGGIYWVVSRRLLLDDRVEQLQDLLPGLSEYLLACYFGPGHSARLSC